MKKYPDNCTNPYSTPQTNITLSLKFIIIIQHCVWGLKSHSAFANSCLAVHLRVDDVMTSQAITTSTPVILAVIFLCRKLKSQWTIWAANPQN